MVAEGEAGQLEHALADAQPAAVEGQLVEAGAPVAQDMAHDPGQFFEHVVPRRQDGGRVAFTMRGTPRGRRRTAAQPPQPPSLESTKAAKKPAAVIRPAASWVCSNASGIMVSANIARMAPAATAVVAATHSGDTSRNKA